MTRCTVCEARTDNAHLCRDHVKILRRTLERIPGLLADLEDLWVGRARMGDRGRGGTRTSDLHGDDNPIGELPGCQCVDECVCDLTKARNERQRRALHRALAAGGSNAAASTLYATIANGLAGWVRHLCETRGAAVPKLRAPNNARWLAAHVKTIALDEAAGELYDDALTWEARIKRMIDHHPGPIPVGPCPDCGIELRAATRDATTVTCTTCDTTYDAGEVREYGSEYLRTMSFTVTELLDLVLPARGIHVHRRYVQMRVRGLEPTGWVGQAPRYAYADVEKALEGQQQVRRRA